MIGFGGPLIGPWMVQQNDILRESIYQMKARRKLSRQYTFYFYILENGICVSNDMDDTFIESFSEPVEPMSPSHITTWCQVYRWNAVSWECISKGLDDR